MRIVSISYCQFFEPLCAKESRNCFLSYMLTKKINNNGICFRNHALVYFHHTPRRLLSRLVYLLLTFIKLWIPPRTWVDLYFKYLLLRSKYIPISYKFYKLHSSYTYVYFHSFVVHICCLCGNNSVRVLLHVIIINIKVYLFPKLIAVVASLSLMAYFVRPCCWFW